MTATLSFYCREIGEKQYFEYFANGNVISEQDFHEGLADYVLTSITYYVTHAQIDKHTTQHVYHFTF